MDQITENVDKFHAKQITLLAMAKDTPKKLRNLAEERHYALSIIADPKAAIAKQYKVYTMGNSLDHRYLKFGLAIPTTYLINHDGKIVWRYVGTREDRPTIELLLQAIDENL